ncbi:hypothetical protein Pint_31610 [Pistacia integerrima]|uniref:Uncharacterized protein n=1 Tax=Pistacia integerrima TaxID=434235 RepID=A0ACC0XSS3_9ROSI|nr:hypothetical protein Pint_31610 [Pistacia integerrima]
MDQDFLSQTPWCYAVIDEAQRLKNPSSVIGLQKACSHPHLFPGIEPEPFVEGEHVV